MNHGTISRLRVEEEAIAFIRDGRTSGVRDAQDADGIGQKQCLD